VRRVNDDRNDNIRILHRKHFFLRERVTITSTPRKIGIFFCQKPDSRESSVDTRNIYRPHLLYRRAVE